MEHWFGKLENWFLNMPQGNRALIAALISVFNFYCIFRIDLRTLIPLWAFCFIIVALIVIGYSVSRRLQKTDNKNFRHFVAWAVFPAFFHVLIGINYNISFNPVSETYTCTQGRQYEHRKYGGGGYHSNTLLYLDHDAYDEYPGIRVFVDVSQIKGARIRYTFERGIFGIRVMKDWEFY